MLFVLEFPHNGTIHDAELLEPMTEEEFNAFERERGPHTKTDLLILRGTVEWGEIRMAIDGTISCDKE